MFENKSEAGETLGNTIAPYAERIISRLIGYFADQRPIKALIRDLDPDMVEMIYEALPGVGGLLLSKIPDSAFKNDASADFVRRIGVEASKSIAHVIKEKKEASDAEIADAIDKAAKEVEEQPVIVDQLDHYHLKDCAKAAKLQKRLCTEISFKAAVDQGLRPATCCYQRIADQKAKAEKAKVELPKGKRLSPLDIIGAADEELRGKFVGWLESLNAEDRHRVMVGLHELDSYEEFLGFMQLSSEMRIQMLPLLEDRHAKHSIKRFLAIVGELVRSGLKGLSKHLTTGWAAYKAWDAQFAPLAEKAKSRLSGPRSRRRRKVRWTWRMLLPF